MELRTKSPQWNNRRIAPATKGTTTGTNQLRNRNHRQNRQLDDRKHRQTTPAQPKLIPIFTQIFSTKGAKTNNQINNQPKYNNKNLLFTISHNVQRWSWAHNQVKSIKENTNKGLLETVGNESDCFIKLIKLIL